MVRMRARSVGWKPPHLYWAKPPQYDKGDGKYDRPPRSGHSCGECFGPRSHYAESLFCSRCEQELFGYRSYKSFLRTARRWTQKYWSDRGQSRTQQ